MRQSLRSLLVSTSGLLLAVVSCSKSTSPPSTPSTPTPRAALIVTSIGVVAERVEGGYRYQVSLHVQETGGVAATLTGADLAFTTGSTPLFTAHFDQLLPATSNICAPKCSVDSPNLVATDTTSAHPSATRVAVTLTFADAVGVQTTPSLSADVPVPPAPQPVTYSLVGTITDQDTQRPIVGSRVEVLNGSNTGRFATTDGTGGYALSELKPDTFRMRASADGYGPGEQNVTVPAIPRADFLLRPSCTLTVTPVRFSVTSGGMVLGPNSERTISVTASAPTCSWTASNGTDDWLYIAAAPSTQRSGYGHFVSGTGSGQIFLSSNASSIVAPRHTSTIRVIWPGGEVDVIACQPNCFAP